MAYSISASIKLRHFLSQHMVDTSELTRYSIVCRNEAKGVPNLLVAPSSPKPKQEEIYADYPQGYYSDGAYTAVPLPSDGPSFSSSKHSVPGELKDPQDTYYASLCSRFTNLRATMQSTPLTSQASPTVTLLRRHKRAVWKGKILKTPPTMINLSLLSQEDIVYGFEVLGDLLTMSNMKSKQYGRNIGAWAWALLGKCRPMGEMGSEEVAVLRDLGKQAVWVMRRIAAGGAMDETWDEAENMVDDADEEVLDELSHAPEETDDEFIDASRDSAAPNGNGEEALSLAQNRLLSSLEANVIVDKAMENGSSERGLRAEEPQSRPELAETVENGIAETTPQTNILATLDMIITIIGEIYGQRDLLEGRFLWDELL